MSGGDHVAMAVYPNPTPGHSSSGWTGIQLRNVRTILPHSIPNQKPLSQLMAWTN